MNVRTAAQNCTCAACALTTTSTSPRNAANRSPRKSATRPARISATTSLRVPPPTWHRKPAPRSGRARSLPGCSAASPSPRRVLIAEDRAGRAVAWAVVFDVFIHRPERAAKYPLEPATPGVIGHYARCLAGIGGDIDRNAAVRAASGHDPAELFVHQPI